MTPRPAHLALSACAFLSFFGSHARAQASTGLNCIQVGPYEFICTLRVSVRELDPISHPLGIIQLSSAYRLTDPLGTPASVLSRGELVSLDQAFGVGYGSGYQVPPGFDPSTLHGLVYPFRDTLTHSGDPYIGLQDVDPQNGILHAPKPGEDFWAISEVLGRANYTASPPGSPPALPRGNPFTGGDDFIDVYSFKVTLADFTPRVLTIDLTSHAADNRVVLADGRITSFIIADTSFSMFVPAPSSLPPILFGFFAATRRRR